MESRGNSRAYTEGGRNYYYSTLHWGKCLSTFGGGEKQSIANILPFEINRSHSRKRQLLAHYQRQDAAPRRLLARLPHLWHPVDAVLHLLLHRQPRPPNHVHRLRQAPPALRPRRLRQHGREPDPAGEPVGDVQVVYWQRPLRPGLLSNPQCGRRLQKWLVSVRSPSPPFSPRARACVHLVYSQLTYLFSCSL